MFELE